MSPRHAGLGVALLGAALQVPPAQLFHEHGLLAGQLVQGQLLGGDVDGGLALQQADPPPRPALLQLHLRECAIVCL